MKSSFEVNKVRRLIKTHGAQFNFVRRGKNDFGEEDETVPPEVTTIFGVYHEQNSYVTVNETNGTRSQSKPTPMLLALWDDVVKNPVKLDDKLEHNGKRYRVTGATNIQEGNYGADISLELIL